MGKDLFAPGSDPQASADPSQHKHKASAKESKTKPELPSLSFEEAHARLEEIVVEMERGTAGLERMLQLFEEGVGLTRLCNSYLEQAQLRVERFIEQRDGQWVLRDLKESSE